MAFGRREVLFETAKMLGQVSRQDLRAASQNLGLHKPTHDVHHFFHHHSVISTRLGKQSRLTGGYLLCAQLPLYCPDVDLIR